MTLDSLITEIEANFPPGWGWLIRHDLIQGYLANIYDKDSTTYFPVYGETPIEVLEMSYKRAQKHWKADRQLNG